MKRFRADRANGQGARMAARWAADHRDALRRADPSIPHGLHDRAADNWGPLFAIADEAGGEWPERARQVAVAMAAREEDGGSHGELLLADIRETFGEIERGIGKMALPDGARIADVDRIRTADLLRILAGREDRPWSELGERRLPINAHGLARLLKPFAIKPTTHRFRKIDRNGAGESFTDKGYLRTQFEDAFARYLPPLVSTGKQ